MTADTPAPAPNLDEIMGFGRLLQRAWELQILPSFLLLLLVIALQYFFYQRLAGPVGENVRLQRILGKGRTRLLACLLIWLLMQVALLPFLRPTELVSGPEVGTSLINMDFYTQEKLRDGTIARDLGGFMRDSMAGQDIMRHPVSGIPYWWLWILTDSTFLVKLAFSLLNLASAGLFYLLLLRLRFGRDAALAGTLLFLANPLNFYGSHEWTFRMSHNQTGLFFILCALLAYCEFRRNGRSIWLAGCIILHWLAFLSYETFLGFVLAYPFLDRILAAQDGRQAPSLATALKRNLLPMAAVPLLSVAAKVLLKPAIGALGFASMSEPMDLGLFLEKWQSFILGDPTQWGVKGMFYYITHFPAYFSALHVYRYLNVFNHPPWGILLMLATAGLNLAAALGLRQGLQRPGLPAGRLAGLGLVLFMSAILTPLLTIGQIVERYIYCGYFGLILSYVAVLVHPGILRRIPGLHGGNAPILLLLALLSMFEYAGFAWALALPQ